VTIGHAARLQKIRNLAHRGLIAVLRLREVPAPFRRAPDLQMFVHADQHDFLIIIQVEMFPQFPRNQDSAGPVEFGCGGFRDHAMHGQPALFLVQLRAGLLEDVIPFELRVGAETGGFRDLEKDDGLLSAVETAREEVSDGTGKKKPALFIKLAEVLAGKHGFLLPPTGDVNSERVRGSFCGATDPTQTSQAASPSRA